MNRFLGVSIFLAIVIASFSGSQVVAGEIGGDEPREPKTELSEILLRDGTLLKGTIIEIREDSVIFETQSLGQITISKANIERMAEKEDSLGVYSDPDQNSIMFCPTPATVPKGDFYFRDFELFFLNFGLGITDDFDLSVGTLFPVSSSATLLSLGGKYRLLDREKHPIGLALTGGFTKLDNSNFVAFGGIAGIGNAQKSLNLSINRTIHDNDNTDTMIVLGGDWQISRRSKLLAEYFSSAKLLDDESDDLNGFINVGFRIFGQIHSFSFSGFRPIGEDTGSFWLWPMVMYSVHF